ncbi:MAG: FtsK/SpoIIIE domain-containing protein [Phycisphaerales bacterium]|nr:FtsK/SpoIIIE domain-containing protein [Phycisphaerales bacterium]
MADTRLIDLVQNTITAIVTLFDRTAANCAAADTQRDQCVASAREKESHARNQLEARAGQTIQNAKAACEAATAEAHQRWEATRRDLAMQAKERREVILDEAMSIRSTAASKEAEASWLAETLYEAGIEGTSGDRKHAEAVASEAEYRQRDVLKKASFWRSQLRLPTTDAVTLSPFEGPELASDREIDSRQDAADRLLGELQGSLRSRLLRQIWLYACLLLPIAAGATIGTLTGTLAVSLPVGGGVGAGLFVGLRLALRSQARAKTLRAEQLSMQGFELARRRLQVADMQFQQKEHESRKERDAQRSSAVDERDRHLDAAGPRTRRRLEKLQTHIDSAQQNATAKRDSRLEASELALVKSTQQAEAELKRQRVAIKSECDAACLAATEACDSAWAKAATDWVAAEADIASDLRTIEHLQQALAPQWPTWSGDWDSWAPPVAFSGDVGIGSITCDVEALGVNPPDDPRFEWHAPHTLTLPIALNFHGRGSLVIESSESRRPEAIAMAQALLARTLTTLPAGRVRLTLYDPVGIGQTFAGFMHLADHEDAGVLERVWTEPRHLEQKLSDITEHMEKVIQTYLRNEYETIDDYNQAAGHIAEPYHILVLTDFPEGITESAARRLASILSSGPRCGVFACIVQDPSRDVPELLNEVEWDQHRVRIAATSTGWSVVNPPLGDFDFTPDSPPPDAMLTTIVSRYGEACAGANRVEVPFSLVAPSTEEMWTRSTTEDLRVALGQSGATRFQELRLGRGTTQHALIAGRTGSGKSTLLHVLITNLALWYSPDEVEFYLVDFKKGVEFQTYAAHALPHARVIAIESDREFGLSVLRKLDLELRRRGDQFRDAGVQDLSGWRSQTSESMPRVLLVVDEFQEFFVNDDALAQEASLLLDRLVRQGRAFGMHVLMGSQTLDGAFSLARSTLGQMGVRVALQCAEADSYLILSDDNPAARLLRRPGDAIYNDAGGKIEGNSPFQVVWLDDRERDEALEQIAKCASSHPTEAPRSQFVFRGNIPSILHADPGVLAMLEGRGGDQASTLDLVLGDPIAIKDQTSMQLRRQTGCNAMLVGQSPERANAVLTAALLQAAASMKPTDDPNTPGLMVWILDGSPPDALFSGRLASFASNLPHQVTRVTARNAAESLARLTDILTSRSDGENADRATILVIGLEPNRIAPLRPADDDFAFSMDEDATPKPDRQFAELLREGPIAGIHAMLWYDGLNNVNRGLSRASQREFDIKVLFQMGANDSGQLIDSTAAADLGPGRAIIHREETGVIEKFRPWAMPDEDWLRAAAAKIRTR